MENRSLIIGKGQIGEALGKVLSCYNPVFLDFHIDLRISAGEFVANNPTIDVMHVCFEYSDRFVKSVKKYQSVFRPKHTVIHSTVPVGTCRKVGAISSPCRGIHPNLEEGIRTFPKFLAGENASELADYFRRAGIKVILLDDQEAAEAGKLFDTEYYRVCIEFCQRVKRFCDQQKINFHETYTLFNQTYNEGYEQLGYPEFIRPILQPIMTKIGGHCVIPNSKIIAKSEK